jgi:putative MATE family efflux protein
MANVDTLSPRLGSAASGHVFRLALPAVGEQMLNTLVGLADIYLVGNLAAEAAAQLGYGSVVAVAGVGLGNQMVWLTMVLYMATGVGSTALIARSVGAADPAATQRFLRQSMLIAVGVGLLALLLIVGLARPFLLALNTPPEVLPRSEEYLHVIAAGTVPTALLFVGMACMRGAGDTRTPLYIMLGANAANVLITWLLVSGHLGFPALGVEGAALGTTIARGGGGLVVLWLLWRGRSGLKLALDLRPDWAAIWRLLRIGLPTAGEMLVFHGALLIFTRFVTGLGTVAYAAHIATINVESISFLPGLGYAVAASTLVGQALGARAPERAAQHAFEALRQGMLFMALVGIGMIVFPGVLLGFFVDDAAAVAAGRVPLQMAGLVQPALALGFILNGALRGAGDTRWPLLSRLLTTWCIRLPLAVLLVWVLDLGLEGIWLAMCIDFTAQGLLALWRFRSGRWKTIEV